MPRCERGPRPRRTSRRPRAVERKRCLESSWECPEFEVAGTHRICFCRSSDFHVAGLSCSAPVARRTAGVPCVVRAPGLLRRKARPRLLAAARRGSAVCGERCGLTYPETIMEVEYSLFIEEFSLPFGAMLHVTMFVGWRVWIFCSDLTHWDRGESDDVLMEPGSTEVERCCSSA